LRGKTLRALRACVDTAFNGDRKHIVKAGSGAAMPPITMARDAFCDVQSVAHAIVSNAKQHSPVQATIRARFDGKSSVARPELQGTL
jgi:hypothetical protein